MSKLQFAARVKVVSLNASIGFLYWVHAALAAELYAQTQAILEPAKAKAHAKGRKVTVDTLYVADRFPQPVESKRENSSVTTRVETKRVRRCNADGKPGPIVAVHLIQHKPIPLAAQDLYGMRMPVTTA
jgi:hypothetical protein